MRCWMSTFVPSWRIVYIFFLRGQQNVLTWLHTKFTEDAKGRYIYDVHTKGWWGVLKFVWCLRILSFIIMIHHDKFIINSSLLSSSFSDLLFIFAIIGRRGEVRKLVIFCGGQNGWPLNQINKNIAIDKVRISVKQVIYKAWKDILNNF